MMWGSIASLCGVHTVFLLDNAIDRGSYAVDLQQSILCRDVIRQSAI
jgi:hypothetical protein